MKDILKFEYHFYPVGQGLFSCGTLRRETSPDPLFVWVYDCGTTSSPSLVTESINDLERNVGPAKRIDLLVLSHFDNDHISGVVELIRRFKIGTLLLPYMHLAQAAEAGFEEGLDSGDPLLEFFVRPVFYLTSIEGPGIEKIAFVRASGESGPPTIDGNPSGSPLPSDGRLEPNIPEAPDFPKEDRERLAPANRANEPATQVVFVPAGAAITCNQIWEFVPYNDDPGEKIPAEFESRVNDLRVELLDATDDEARENALSELKDVYDDQFGKSAKQRNVISLSLYSGPVYPSWTRWGLVSVSRFPHYPFPPWPRAHFLWGLGQSRCSLLYTGDAYLDTSEKLKRFIAYLNDGRISKVGVFQVMHHGAEGNWHKGSADEIRPLFSVFSSDPQHKGFRHPHAPVLRDFWPFGPVQVDKLCDFSVRGLLK